MKYTVKAITQNPEKYVGDATACAVTYLERNRHKRWSNFRHTRIDRFGYWYEYKDSINGKTVLCITYHDVLKHCRAVHT